MYLSYIANVLVVGLYAVNNLKAACSTKLEILKRREYESTCHSTLPDLDEGMVMMMMVLMITWKILRISKFHSSKTWMGKLVILRKK